MMTLVTWSSWVGLETSTFGAGEALRFSDPWEKFPRKTQDGFYGRAICVVNFGSCRRAENTGELPAGQGSNMTHRSDILALTPDRSHDPGVRRQEVP